MAALVSSWFALVGGSYARAGSPADVPGGFGTYLWDVSRSDSC
jgi:hypothetical protein